MSTERQKKRRDTIVEHYTHEQESALNHLERVVAVAIDKSSAPYVYEWAINNYIQPEKDLVVLIHVRPLEIPISPYIETTSYDSASAKEYRAESHELLKAYASKLWDRRIACKAISMIGEAKSEIVRKVMEVKADTLIMGSRRMGTIKRALLGSVSDHCVHHAPCTVIIVKPEAAENTLGRTRSIFNKK